MISVEKHMVGVRAAYARSSLFLVEAFDGGAGPRLSRGMATFFISAERQQPSINFYVVCLCL
jgi:hypothetical protein